VQTLVKNFRCSLYERELLFQLSLAPDGKSVEELRIFLRHSDIVLDGAGVCLSQVQFCFHLFCCFFKFWEVIGQGIVDRLGANDLFIFYSGLERFHFPQTQANYHVGCPIKMVELSYIVFAVI